MIINQIIHPEILLGKRGTPAHKYYYEGLLENLKLQSDGSFLIPKKYNGFVDDPIAMGHLVTCRYFLANKGKSYYFPKPFTQALASMDRVLPVEYLPEKFIGYLHFADGGISDDGGEIEGAYVFLGNPDDLGIQMEAELGKRVFAVYYINKLQNKNGFWAIGKAVFPVLRETITEIGAKGNNIDYIEGVKQNVPAEVTQARLALWRAVVNAVLYIHSEDPEIAVPRPRIDLTRFQREEERRTKPAENLCTIPLTLVTWDFHKTIYNVDSTVVRTHLRWQRCGPELSRVKLIKIEEHERHYKKEET